MKITKVVVDYGATVNLGNFNSAKFTVGMEAELEPGEDAEAVVRRLHEQCLAEVKRQALPVIRKNSDKLADIFRHLPDSLQREILEKIDAN